MRLFYLILGIISFSLGFIGAFIPVLPTTPLILLALFCFSKSSKKFEEKLINSKIYKKYLEEFIVKRSLPLKRKIFLVSFATIMMLFPLVILDSVIVKIIIILLLIYLYYYFIFKIKNS